MKITLKQLSLINFKGIKSLVIDFNPTETTISGDNGTGKTTVFDAFTFLLFGKDSLDRKDFNVKTLDEFGKSEPQVAHDVEGKFFIDNGSLQSYEMTFRKSLTEKWVKPRGKAEVEFQGHETTYFIDTVPYTMKDYNVAVEKLCSESVFKLITNPMYFPALNWTIQRKTLIALAGGNVSDQEIINGNVKFQKLFEKISGKALDIYKRQIANEKARIKGELEKIPTRIDEANRQILSDMVDTSGHQKKIDKLEKSITEIDLAANNISLTSKKNNELKLSAQKSINDCKSRMTDIAFQVKQALKKEKNTLQGQINSLKDRKDALEQSNKSLQSRIRELKEQNTLDEQAKTVLLDDYKKIKAETFPGLSEGDTVCPTCKRQWDIDQYEQKESELIESFNLAHSRKLQDNIIKGKTIKATIEKRTAQIEEYEKAINEATVKIGVIVTEKEGLEKQIPTITEDQYEDITEGLLKGSMINKDKERAKQIEDYRDLELIITEKQNEIQGINNQDVENIDTEAVVSQKTSIRTEIDSLKRELQTGENVKQVKKRITELMEQQETLAQELANYEKDEYLIAEFTKAKISAVEQKINSMFKMVKFRMYDFLINGGEEETCEASVNGVPYSDLNKACKINAGLDIINTISRSENIYAPVFIDNREATNRIIEMNTQIVNLRVSYDKQLVVS